jgi:hypothetical protein
MRRLIVGGLVAGSLILGGATVAFAGQPDNPGCFGQDRADNNKGYQQIDAPGASDWGHIAADRAGTNGTENYLYRVYYCGGGPT